MREETQAATICVYCKLPIKPEQGPSVQLMHLGDARAHRVSPHLTRIGHKPSQSSAGCRAWLDSARKHMHRIAVSPHAIVDVGSHPKNQLYRSCCCGLGTRASPLSLRFG